MRMFMALLRRELSSRMRPCIKSGKIRKLSNSNISFTDDKGLKRPVESQGTNYNGNYESREMKNEIPATYINSLKNKSRLGK